MTEGGKVADLSTVFSNKREREEFEAKMLKIHPSVPQAMNAEIVER